MSDNVPAQMPTRANSIALKDCKSLGDAFQSGEFKDRVKQGLPQHLNANAMLRTFVQAVTRTPLLMKVETRQAIGAFLTLSQLGLMPNNALGEAYLIPFARNKWNPATRQRELQGYDLTVIIGYKGYLSLAFRSGLVGAVHSDVVYPGDEFDYVYGSRQNLAHRPTGNHPDDALPTHAYSVAHLTGAAAGEPPFRVMPWTEILRTRNGSQGYQAALAMKENAETKGWKLPAGYTETPWVKHIIPMAMKTAFLRLSTWIPRSLELAGAAAIDEAGDRGARVNFGSVLEGGTVVDQTIDITEAEPGADTGFGIRVPNNDEEPQQDPRDQQQQTERQQPQQTDQRQHQQHQAAPPTQQPQAVPFEGYLCDENGELTDHGKDGRFTDPVAWAEAYASIWNKAADRPTLRENNEDSLTAIAEHHHDAQAVIAALDQAMPQSDANAAAVPIVRMPMRGTRMDLAGYIAAVKAAVADLTPEQARAWNAANSATYAPLPSGTRRSVHALINARMMPEPAADTEQETAAQAETDPETPKPTAAEQTTKPSPTEEHPTDTTPETDHDLEWARDMVLQINRTKSHYDLTQLSKNPAVGVGMRRLTEHNRPELTELIKEASDAKSKSFT